MFPCVCVRTETSTLFQKTEQGKGRGVHLRGERKAAKNERMKDERPSTGAGEGRESKHVTPTPWGLNSLARLGLGVPDRPWAQTTCICAPWKMEQVPMKEGDSSVLSSYIEHVAQSQGDPNPVHPLPRTLAE